MTTYWKATLVKLAPRYFSALDNTDEWYLVKNRRRTRGEHTGLGGYTGDYKRRGVGEWQGRERGGEFINGANNEGAARWRWEKLSDLDTMTLVLGGEIEL